MRRKTKIVLFYLSLLAGFIPSLVKAQSVCPVNIGFELGDFTNWECSMGAIDGVGNITLSNTGPVWGNHTILANTITTLDPYGLFPIVCPNGSNYSIQLGNEGTGSEAERASYTFTIPAGQNKYTIIFNYAVVLENPNHAPSEQPKFTANVFDVTANEYINCATFEFVAGPNLPGFLPSQIKAGVFYKNWSPVTINLSGYAGKTIRLDFTTNDCTRGGHFGYAYIDVDENCTDPIKGNVYCAGDTSVKLIAPFGFLTYKWYNANFTQVLGSDNFLNVNPAPPNGTVYAVIVTPHPGLGCLDTLYTTISSSPQVLTLQVKDTVEACLSTGVDLTQPQVTAGSTPGLNYNYYTDALGTIYLPGPKFIKVSGEYYIVATNAIGCRSVKPVYVNVLNPPHFQVQDTLFGCENTADLTSPTQIISADPGVTISYWLDSLGVTPVLNPTTLASQGTYIIRATSPEGCHSYGVVQVTIPKMSVNDQTACGTYDLASPIITSGSSPGFTYSYWTNNSATTPVANPQAITSSGTFYIKGTHERGCTAIKPVVINIKPVPNLVVQNLTANYPELVNLNNGVISTSGTSFAFFKDSAATQPLASPTRIGTSGRYYVRAYSGQGCSSVAAINVTIVPPPPITYEAPNAFSPNGDGTNDQFTIKVRGTFERESFRIFNRYGQEVAEVLTGLSWDGRMGKNGPFLPFGTYYWVLEVKDSYTSKKLLFQGSITVIK